MHDEASPAPWERQPQESAKAFAAFRISRDLPPWERSLRRAAEKIVRRSKRARSLNGTLRLLERWSSRCGWVERAVAWDEEQDRLKREAELAERLARVRERVRADPRW